METHEKLSLDQIRSDVSEVLGADQSELSDEDDLIDLGLDSIRVMRLVEKWRAVGAETSFVELAETPTINGWYRLLREA